MWLQRKGAFRGLRLGLPSRLHLCLLQGPALKVIASLPRALLQGGDALQAEVTRFLSCHPVGAGGADAKQRPVS